MVDFDHFKVPHTLKMWARSLGCGSDRFIVVVPPAADICADSASGVVGFMLGLQFSKTNTLGNLENWKSRLDVTAFEDFLYRPGILSRRNHVISGGFAAATLLHNGLGQFTALQRII